MGQESVTESLGNENMSPLASPARPWEDAVQKAGHRLIEAASASGLLRPSSEGVTVTHAQGASSLTPAGAGIRGQRLLPHHSAI